MREQEEQRLRAEVVGAFEDMRQLLFKSMLAAAQAAGGHPKADESWAEFTEADEALTKRLKRIREG